jgi:hypothetical protein
MWPGYKFGVYHTSINGPSDYYLKIKSVHAVIRLENVLEKLLIIRELSQEQNLDFQSEIRKVFKGIKVISKYNNICYFVKDICFDMNTESTFTLTHKKETFDVSFYDYFTKRYGVEIT